MQNNIGEILAKNSIIPVVTIQSEEELNSIYDKLKAQNIQCIEITLRTPYAWEAIAEYKNRFGKEFSVGVGTITSVEQVVKCQELGVDFMVSPGYSAELISAMKESNIAFLPGAVTPGEIIKGMELGLSFFKFFPANLFGGIEAMKAYGSVFKGIKFCPTGGVNEHNSQDFLALENVVSVGGTWLLNK
jgi:2-dehydro-3-deoxyphosphogluconate aldolase/(4S)-4-hydroxy-2-oxoglutarate aldolase